MANLSSVEFEGVKCKTVFIPESNDLSTDANEETNASGLFLNPSENVMGRSGDITGYILKSSNNQGKLEWVNPTTEAEYNTVRVATVSNIVITDPISSIDDILLNDEDRVLIKDQTDTTQNGIYVVDNGFFVRPNDAEFGISAFGVYYFVAEGTINYNTVWLCSDYETTFGEPITFNAIRIAGNEDLPAPIESIANLTTVGNEIIYTIATDTYATSPITPTGRSFLSLNTNSEQRIELGLEIGTDVQAHSSTLDTVVSIVNTSDRLIYTVGGFYSGTPVTAFVRTNLLPATDATSLANNLGYIIGPISTTNRMLKVSASNTVTETGLSVDASNNLTGVNDITATGSINGVTNNEFTQLANIDSTTISTTQWGFLGAMDQGVSTSSTPTFNGLSAGTQKITAIAVPTDAQDAANKSYVDTAVASGTTPLTGTNYATTAALPNSPVYASPAETLTSTGGPGSLDIDGQTVLVGERLLIKNQVDNRENGVYDVTDDGATPGPNWVLTRSLDFNQAATPIPAGSSIFINTVPGASNSASTWTLRTTVNTIDPLTDAVEWIQTGGSIILASGLGIDATQLAGGTIQTDISARLTYSGNDLDLNTVTVPYGGTGLTTITSGNVMVGQGAAAVSATKAAPTGDFIGTTDTQTLTNKTMTSSSNNITSRGLFSNSGSNTVSTFAATSPSIGQVLTATGATTATWQNLDDYIVGPVSTVNRLIKVSGSNLVIETGLSIDASDNLTGINDITTSGDIITTGTINGITNTEFTQLSNIDSTTISTTQWGFLGAMDQGVATTDTPTFNGLSAGSQKITAVLDPTNAQDAATKTYVDTVASTGSAPLTSANYATAATLPNTPAYASPAETITSTGGPGTLVIDGQTVSVSDRILVKNQADNRENGVYIVSDDGATPGPNWVLTRAIDFNQAATPVSAGTSIFIEIVSGASQSGSTWSLQTTVTTIDPLTDAVTWVQIGGSPSFTAGLGIDTTQLAGGTIQTDISARLTYTGNDLDLNTVTVPYGGTGLTTITSGNVMVGQGAAAVSATKTAPTGDFIGTTDTQTLTNKTMTDNSNDLTSRALFTGSGAGQVSTFAATAPTSGQVLTATSGTVATWQTPQVTLTGSQTLTNKTITDNSNDVNSRALFVDSGAGIVSTFAAAVPSVGQVLTATGASTATWQNVGDVTLNGSQTLTNKTITDNSNDVNSRALFVDSGAGIVSTFTAAVPSVGQVLTATGASSATWQNVGDVTLNGSQTLTNKTITDNTNNIISRGMFTGSGTGTLSTYSAIAPLSGQVLTATSGTTATWQTPTVGDVTLNGVQTLTNKTMTSNTNELIARELFIDSGSASISTFAASVPSSGQVLTATSGTTATWQTPTVGDVTLNGVETLTNKTINASTNDVTARGVFTNSGANTVSTFAAANPTSGQVLTATGATTATWQSPSSGLPTYTNTLTVSPSNPDVSPNWTTLGAAITDAISLVPTETNQVLIIMFPGIYSETTPLTVPSYVSISGQISTQNAVIVRPSAPAPVGSVLVLSNQSRIYGIVVDGNDGAGGNSTLGISFISSGSELAYLNSVTVRNCSQSGLLVSGDGTQFSTIVIAKNTSILVTQAFPFSMTNGIELTDGAILSGNDFSISGFLSGGGFLTNGIVVKNDFSYLDVTNVGISSVSNGIVVGTGVSSNFQNDFARARVIGGTMGFITAVGLYVDVKSSIFISSFTIDDDTSIFPSQLPVFINSPSLPSEPNFLKAASFIFRVDLASLFNGALNNPTLLLGEFVNTLITETQTNIFGNLSIGGPSQGYELIAGEGNSHVFGLNCFIDDGGVFSDVSENLKQTSSNLTTFDVELATTASINITSAPATIDGVVPTSGVSRILIKDGSTANPGATSVDNGIYVWNGTGVAMTRAVDFNTGDTFPKNVSITVSTGDTNYSSIWLTVQNSITIGTTAFSLNPNTSPAFPLTPANNDAFYVGSNFLIQFPGIKITMTNEIVLSSGVITDAIAWEYFNGVSWVELPLMSTASNSPYQAYANNTFSVDNPIVGVDLSYQYRFGNITSSWATTTVNSVLAYWVRARVIDASIISTVPIIQQIKLHTNRTEINKDGFMEYFGEGRTRKKISIDTRSMTLTGVGNPNNQNLIAAIDGADEVRLNIRDNVFTSGADLGLGHLFVLPTNIDTSFTMRMTVYFIQTAAGAGDVAFKVNYVLTDDNSIIDPSGTPNTQLKTTDIVLTTVTGTAGQQQRGVLELDVSNYIAGQNVFWFNFFRFGSDVGDTYASNINVIVFEIDYVIWNNGKDLQL